MAGADAQRHAPHRRRRPVLRQSWPVAGRSAPSSASASMSCCSTPARSITRWSINGTRLGIDFGAIEAVVLSHGHWDHAGGLLKAFELMRAAAPGRARADLPASRHVRRARPAQPDGGILPMAAGADTGRTGTGRRRSPRSPTSRNSCSTACSIVSGEIPRVTAYETGLANQVRRTASGDWEAGPAADGRALPRRRGEGQGRRRVHRVLACRRGECADARARLLSRTRSCTR